MHSSLPPYHPDYVAPVHGDASSYYASEDSSSSADEYTAVQNLHQRETPVAVRVRRGSEGYEVRAVDREETLRRYIEEQAQEEGRYNRYVPEPDMDSEEEEEEETFPLASKMEGWRADTRTVE